MVCQFAHSLLLPEGHQVSAIVTESEARKLCNKLYLAISAGTEIWPPFGPQMQAPVEWWRKIPERKRVCPKEKEVAAIERMTTDNESLFSLMRSFLSKIRDVKHRGPNACNLAGGYSLTA